jgi:hypothetical protein
MTSPNIERLLNEIALLPEDWHKAGSVSIGVLHGIARHVGSGRLTHSVETGSGKTTLLLSHLSDDHKVFAINQYADVDTGSVSNVRTSPLFNPAAVEFIDGPTQMTLLHHRFNHKLQLALIDGPHGYPFPNLEYYNLYPHLEQGALLILDDIHIPTIRNLFDFIRVDEMFELLEVIETTAFFRRTAAPTFSSVQDGWWLQNFNRKHFPVPYGSWRRRWLQGLSWLRPVVPASVRSRLKRWMQQSSAK